MIKQSLLSLTIGGLLAAPAIPAFADNMPSAEEMWRIIQQQQKEIAELKSQAQTTEEKATAAVEAVESRGGTGGNWADKTTIGGYGELHYNNLSGEGGASDKDEFDFHRFVVFLGHEFNEDVRFFSELEIEHALVEDTADGSGPGEVELEQAYIEVDLNDQHRTRAGVFLLPVGIMNETHEPPTFYGVERNPVESNIIPATWWAAGAGISGELAQGFSYDLAVHEGLNTSSGSSYKPRSGRQKSAKAAADDFAYTARLKWTGIPGVEIAGTFQHQTDMTQSSDSTAGSGNLYEIHGIYNKGPFGLRALYALWDLDGAGPASIGADEQVGWYIEPSYRINDSWGVFTRYNQYDNTAGDSISSEKTQWDVGVNWWVHPDVVFKADYQTQDNDNGQDQNGFNLGVGFQF